MGNERWGGGNPKIKKKKCYCIFLGIIIHLSEFLNPYLKRDALIVFFVCLFVFCGEMPFHCDGFFPPCLTRGNRLSALPSVCEQTYEHGLTLTHMDIQIHIQILFLRLVCTYSPIVCFYAMCSFIAHVLLQAI